MLSRTVSSICSQPFVTRDDKGSVFSEAAVAQLYIASPRSTTHIYQTRIATLHIWSSSIHMFPPAPLHTLFSFDFPGIIRCIVSFGSFLSLLLKS